MSTLVRRVVRPAEDGPNEESALTREWLVTNGLGGYASGTVLGIISRRYHGLLIAALPAPLGRTMMLNDLVITVHLPGGRTVQLGGEEREGHPLKLHGADFLTEFRLEMGLPVWRYEIEGTVLESRIVMPHGQNTVHVHFCLVNGQGPVRIDLRPSLHFRPHETDVSSQMETSYALTVNEDRYEVSAGLSMPCLRFYLDGRDSSLSVDRQRIEHVLYRIESSRGYAARGDLWSPGHLTCSIELGKSAVLVASTEDWETIRALTPAAALESEYERRRRLLRAANVDESDSRTAELVLAADQFLIQPAGRIHDSVRARAAGDEVRTVIAGYHWFTDWGRDTMISLEGLTLSTGRHLEAAWILRTFAYYIRDGLIPNMFPEGGKQGLYHTADATLWFFHALHRYLERTGDRFTLRLILPKLLDIVDRHIEGTRFGIGVDESDGLLRQGQEDYQLTWMDAKVDGWVVTPRRGKAVEINALWYNALMLLETWLKEEDRADAAPRIADYSARARDSFNKRFWYEQGGYLYDVVDGEQGDDMSCRPNQILSFSLEHPILDRARWQPVFDTVRARLLTPLGLRSLDPHHPDYKKKYFGDLRSRDAAYHQGTVWGWLIGPYIDALLKLSPDNYEEAQKCLEGFDQHLGEGCVGSISEIFDAESPFTQRGCIAQAWSVAEVLRCWRKIESNGHA